MFFFILFSNKAEENHSENTILISILDKTLMFDQKRFR